MSNPERALREAASAFKAAHDAAVQAGYKVSWPSSASGLDSLSISETAAVSQPAEMPPAAPAKARASKPAAGDSSE